MKTAYLYLRASTKRQDKSTTDQRNACINYAKKKRIKIVGEFEDNGISGYKDTIRPAFEGLLSACKKLKPDYVLVWSLDRFSRQYKQGMIELLTLEILGVKLMDTEVGIYSSDSFGDAITQVVRQFAAEDYSAKISNGVKRGHDRLRAEGYLTGHAPYGLKRKREKRGTIWIVDKRPAKIVTEIFTRYDAGETCRSITKNLNKRRIQTKRGNSFHVATVWKILKAHCYGGNQLNSKDPFDFRKSRIETFIDYDLWFRTYSSIHSRDIILRCPKRMYPLTGYMFCVSCGRKMIVYGYGDHDEKAYRCSGIRNGGCTNPDHTYKANLELAVLNTILPLKEKKKGKNHTRILITLKKKEQNLITAISDIGYNPAIKSQLLLIQSDIKDIEHTQLLSTIDRESQPMNLNNLLPLHVVSITIESGHKRRPHTPAVVTVQLKSGKSKRLVVPSEPLSKPQLGCL